MIKGFIFDLDGVITDTAILHFLAWQKVLKDNGIEYTESENEQFRGLPRLDTLEAILKYKNKENYFNYEQKQKICDLKNDYYLSLLSTQVNENSILPGIKEFLTEAKKEKIKLAIASSSYNAPLILEKLGIINYFDFIVNPATIKNGKPAPDIFISAANGLNLKTNECIGFEDASVGVQGIKKANILAVAITTENEKLFANADLILNSTKELSLQLIKSTFKKEFSE
ncbi:beta-phosphoglucomutase [Mycoplasmopsis gallinacea]|uniref:Beta-phosphoglucomutase n=1 Tax=Mycoplasmopsis gallinacea TaxID=29556 RepID=A0A0D5ZK19_9BACT|nr:beta-phosphoglucomutase [Mycoplasmopsis gallinacea]